MELGESKDDIFSAIAHDIEKMLLGNPFNIHVKGAGIADCTSLVHSLVYVPNCNGGCESLGGELVFSDKLPVDAGDIHARVY